MATSETIDALFPNRIPRVDWLRDGAKVPVDNSSDATYSEDREGVVWIRKSIGVEEILAESIAWLLGRHIGAPMPEAAVYLRRGDFSWLSRQVGPPDPTQWSHAFAMRINNLAGLGAMLALDVIVLEEDRHARNILLQPDPDELHLRAWAIDSGDAKVGWIDDYLDRIADVPNSRNIARGLPIDLMTDGAVAAAECAAAIEKRELESWVREACEIAQEPRSSLLAEALLRRCRDAPALVSRYLPLAGIAP